MSWQERAACVDHKDVFWPNGDTPSTHAEVTAARAICATCPVTTDCLDYALSLSPRPSGVWAGTTSNERRKMPQRRDKECVRCGGHFVAQAGAKFCSHTCQQAHWMRRRTA